MWARILAGSGSAVAGVVFLAYVYGFFGPETPESMSVEALVLLVAKTAAVGSASILLLGAAVRGWVVAIIGGCVLFLVDFMLWLVWNPFAWIPPLGPWLWLVILAIWVVFPIFTMLLTIVRLPS